LEAADTLVALYDLVKTGDRGFVYRVEVLRSLRLDFKDVVEIKPLLEGQIRLDSRHTGHLT
jgi:hypothetical protein